jgi:hypothetical protein
VAAPSPGCNTVEVEGASEGAPEPITVRLDWGEAATVPVQHANQALGQLGTPVKGIPDGIYLIIGSVEPLVIPDEESRAQAIEDLTAHGVRVTVQGRFHISRQAADELMRVLGESVALYDAVVRATEERKAVPPSQEE